MLVHHDDADGSQVKLPNAGDHALGGLLLLGAVQAVFVDEAPAPDALRVAVAHAVSPPRDAGVTSVVRTDATRSATKFFGGLSAMAR